MADFPIYCHIRYDAELNKNGKLELVCTDVSDHDFVEVVRCKDCRENDKTGYETADFGYCGCLNREVQDCFYCSFGERRADNA